MSTPPGGPTRDTTGTGGQSGAAPAGTAGTAGNADTEGTNQQTNPTHSSTPVPGPAGTNVDTEAAGGGPGSHGLSPGTPGTNADTTQAGPPGSTGPVYRAPSATAPAQETDTTRTDTPVTDGSTSNTPSSSYAVGGTKDTSAYGGPVGASGGTTVPGAPPAPTVTAGPRRVTVSYVVPATALATPSAPTAAQAATGGTLAAATYAYKVVAKNANGRSAASAATANVVVASGTTNKVTLTITAVPGATSYDVYGRTGGTFGYLGTTSTTSFVDTGSATPGAVPPAASSVSRGSSPVTQMVIEGSTGGTTYAPVNANSVDVVNLVPDQSYTFRVRAINGAGGGPWSPASDPVAPTNPDKPQ